MDLAFLKKANRSVGWSRINPRIRCRRVLEKFASSAAERSIDEPDRIKICVNYRLFRVSELSIHAWVHEYISRLRENTQVKPRFRSQRPRMNVTV